MSKDNRDDIIEGALAGGLIGAALGAFLTKKGNGTLVAALVGVAIGASIKAQKEAKKLEFPVLYEHNGKLFREYSDGRREFLENIPYSEVDIPDNFEL